MGKKYKILFDSYHLYHLPQFESLIDLLATDDRFEIYHSTSRKIQKKEYELCKSILNDKPGQFISGKDEEERKKNIRELDLDIFICGWSRYNINQFVNEKTLVCMAYHGIGIKPSYWRDNHKRIDIRFVEGPYRMNQLKEKGIDAHLTLTGFMKLDYLFQEKKINTDDIIESLGIDSAKKTILYAPTFYPSSVEPIGMRLGEYTKDYNLIIKPHLWISFDKSISGMNFKGQKKIFSNLAAKFDHIKLISPNMYNITPLYQISDLLITEASSTIYEMLSLSKPILVNRFYKLKLSHRFFRNRLYNARLNKSMEKEISQFCFEAHSPEELPHMIETAISNISSKISIMETYKEKMLYNLDGKASIRVRDAILERLESPI
ncbi:MAG: CDP-glycerol glycerophosphotransferase family protein [Candidatus Neomarinimicrobiota bacterium]